MTKRRQRGPTAPAPREPGLTHLLRAARIPGAALALGSGRAPPRPPAPPASAAPTAAPRSRSAARPGSGSALLRAGSFSAAAAAALRPLSPDVRRGGVGGGRGRDAKARPGGGCDPRRPACAPPAVRPGARARALPVPGRPAPQTCGLRPGARGEVGWRGGGAPSRGTGESDSPGRSEVSPGDLRRTGLGNGAQRLPTPYLQEWAGAQGMKSRLLLRQTSWSLRPQFCLLSWSQSP